MNTKQLDDIAGIVGAVIADQIAPLKAEIDSLRLKLLAMPSPANGKDGADGKDGIDGRDALEIDILPEVLPGKSYRHKTFARWRGGLIRAVRNTDPLMPGDDDVLENGWSIVVNGVDGPVDKSMFDTSGFAKTFEAALND